jgi:hypothetical protein
VAGGGEAEGLSPVQVTATTATDVVAVERHAHEAIRRASRSVAAPDAEPASPPTELLARPAPTPGALPRREDIRPHRRRHADRPHAERADPGSQTALKILSPIGGGAAGVDVTIPLLALMMFASAAIARRQRGSGRGPR